MLHDRNKENVLHWKEFFFPQEKESIVPAMPNLYTFTCKHKHWSQLLRPWWLLKEPFIYSTAELVSACFSLPLNNNIGKTFCRCRMYVEHFSTSTLSIQNLLMPPRSSSFFFGLTCCEGNALACAKKFDQVENERFWCSLPPVNSFFFHEAAG